VTVLLSWKRSVAPHWHELEVKQTTVKLHTSSGPQEKRTLDVNSNKKAADVSYIRCLLLMLCRDQRLSGPKRYDNPGCPLIGWQSTAQGGPRPTTRVSNHMDAMLPIPLPFENRNCRRTEYCRPLGTAPCGCADGHWRLWQIRCLHLQGRIIIRRQGCLWTKLYGVISRKTVAIIFSAVRNL
jgi:hypothetical protein